MQRSEIWPAIELELRKARKKHPNWPEHIVAQAAIVTEESGELIKACLQYKYERSNLKPQSQLKEIEKEAIQTAAMAIRFLENL